MANDLTGNNHRMVSSSQLPCAGWPPGLCLACGNAVSGGVTAEGDG
jgi:hypothetical protein